MSNSTYNKMWAEAQEGLNNLLQTETEDKSPKPLKDHPIVFQMLATFYVKYVQIFHNLETAYDQIVHPQKRLVIRQVLEGVMGRILELKNEMVELENSEFHYFDDILQDQKLCPEHIEIPIPRYFIKEKLKVLKEREKILAQILVNAGLQDIEPKKHIKVMTFEEAIRIIQISERARQGRLRAEFMKQIYLEEKRERQARLHSGKSPNLDASAVCIQKVWRGYIQMKRTEKIREEEMIFLGMSPPPHFHRISASLMQAQRVEAMRCEVQEKHEEEYKKALVAIKNRLREMEGPDIKESLQEQIRQWFIECRHITGKFPDYPDEEDGGSIVIFSQKTPEQVAAELAAKEEELQKKSKDKGKKGKKEKEKKKKGKEKGKEKQEKKANEEKEGWKMAPSNFLPIMEEGNNWYKDVWQHREEGWNFHQEYDPELVKEEKRKEVKEEIRVQVDELMRQELKNLKLAVDREKDKKKRSGKKDKVSHAGLVIPPAQFLTQKWGYNLLTSRSGTKTRTKSFAVEDYIKNARTIDSLYKELVEGGLLIKPKTVKLSDYVGEYSYLGTTLRQVDIEPMPSLADVRQLIALYGILPLGSQALHEKSPLVKALLLAGPAGVGKKMLVHALCTETGANLFNLSASNIAGKYPGKSGLQMLLNMVFKVAKQLQPSVVWIGNTEKTFYKKVPKAEKEMEPKRLKKNLPKILKSLKAEDRVLIVGTTTRPFDADLRPFCKVYKKIILIPRPDYASRFALWKHIILQNGGSLSKSPTISCLAKMSDGFTQGHIIYAAQTILSERRIRQLNRKPLTAVELMGALARQDPVYKEEEDMFKAWYAKTPLGKARAKALMEESGVQTRACAQCPDVHTVQRENGLQRRHQADEAFQRLADKITAAEQSKAKVYVVLANFQLFFQQKSITTKKIETLGMYVQKKSSKYSEAIFLLKNCQVKVQRDSRQYENP
ncbi:IQ and AAA domain-containing protein 1 isoform B [Alligator mississippiensis]|uniref:IQ and AAA domain-containing protein 1 isoform B n=1 Tax=Alligator mississippiensis TaxID=8496 RepID=A0A151N9P2_ALLMI|nr:IQ and AAA domain-containing protein 1 isoform B [Alligator mississippiensis]